mmetsp:Transcript_1940/g.4020  ORF Transcript_1940/g.4020 Transcript_1940/m.4020 type:complete len:258 (-) Transcript_1940:467-1240(-)
MHWFSQTCTHLCEGEVSIAIGVEAREEARALKLLLLVTPSGEARRDVRPIGRITRARLRRLGFGARCSAVCCLFGRLGVEVRGDIVAREVVCRKRHLLRLVIRLKVEMLLERPLRKLIEPNVPVLSTVNVYLVEDLLRIREVDPRTPPAPRARAAFHPPLQEGKLLGHATTHRMWRRLKTYAPNQERASMRTKELHSGIEERGRPLVYSMVRQVASVPPVRTRICASKAAVIASAHAQLHKRTRTQMRTVPASAPPW